MIKPIKKITNKINKNNRTLNADKILLVDDDNVFRSEFKECFSEYGIKEASSAEEALAILKKPNEIDLVILDIRMQGMDGLTALKKIKKIDPDLSIMISTAYSSKDTAVEALRNHADEYIEKPLDIDKAKQVIDRLLEEKINNQDISSCDMSGKMEKIKRFIERNCFKKISLNDAADIVYLSTKYLSRVFKQSTGHGFRDFRINVKIDKAKELLEKTGYKIDQISDKLAYQNTESFIRQFKKLTGSTPTQYRAQKVKASKKNFK